VETCSITCIFLVNTKPFDMISGPFVCPKLTTLKTCQTLYIYTASNKTASISEHFVRLFTLPKILMASDQ